ncbi:hypothetical protein GCM10009098_12930 [Rheinheimera aquimaris]|uniref:MotA/TolQ/ExbB proton channel domain-containing protein n=1 Tax=Rheinheimera aquimaris TaxID=412437 RepID=A0ABP3NL18_9GAMM|nr:MotA/TolQ/ExbB proton channel family protein [Rheinheimera aquimaris]MCB5213135.1 MotA/TolQ/ExbB proton channel family protein [Rheinheimera aquimaris]
MNSSNVLAQIIRQSLCAALLSFVALSHPAAAADISSSVLADIKQAQQNLSNTEQQISRQQQQLVSQYQTLQQQVQQLRDKTAVARRAEDESTLGLNQLTERLKSWQDQQQYQQNQLASFIRQQQLVTVDASLISQLQAASNFAGALQQSLYPAWHNHDIILPSGELVNARVLQVGPVSWYWQDEQQQGGLLQHSSDKAGNLSVALPFNDASALQQLQQQQRAKVLFDPSLNKALLRSNQHESALSHVSKGGIWALPILAFALVALIIALHKAWQLWRLPAVQVAALPSAQLQHSTGFARQLGDCAKQYPLGQQRDDALFAVLQHSRLTLDARLGAIAVTAAVAPLLGLLGTVSGMIETFNMMTLFGSGDPQVVSGGIAQALITTELGLVVAIPALVLHALLSRKARNYYHQLEALALHISQQPGRHTATTQEQAA